MDKKEYIERGALIESLKKQYGEELGWQCTVNMSDVGMMIEDAPAANVVYVRHGEWKKRGNEKKCSSCTFIYYSNNDEWTFCPNCGARMDGERKEQT